MPSWVQSSCNPADWVMRYPGQGDYHWTAAFGTVWVGTTWTPYAQQGQECGGLREPCKEYAWVSEKRAVGQWFRGGLIWRAPGGYWVIELGDWGQTGGRLTDEPMPAGANQPPDWDAPRPPVPKPPSRWRRWRALS